MYRHIRTIHMITIDFTKTYPPVSLEKDYTSMTFYSPQINDTEVMIIVQLKSHPISRLPNVYNLGFGPSDGKGSFLDNVPLQHADRNIVFSTIMLLALAFLIAHPQHIIGLDGSSDARARIYHMMFRSNISQLAEHFETNGLDYYVKQLRDGKLETDTENKFIYIPIPEPFDYSRSSKNLYRYYMFYLK